MGVRISANPGSLAQKPSRTRSEHFCYIAGTQGKTHHKPCLCVYCTSSGDLQINTVLAFTASLFISPIKQDSFFILQVEHYQGSKNVPKVVLSAIVLNVYCKLRT